MFFSVAPLHMCLCLRLHVRRACSDRVCLHNGSWCFCSGGLRSWEKHETVTQPLCSFSVPALWLLQTDPSTILTQPAHFPAASSTKVRGNHPLRTPPSSLRNTWRTLLNVGPQRQCRNSEGNTSDFLCYCSQHPTFILQRSPPLITLCPPDPHLLLLSLPNPCWLFLLTVLVFLLLFSFCFLFLSPQAATKKKFGNGDFRSALENGVLLCE